MLRRLKGSTIAFVITLMAFVATSTVTAWADVCGHCDTPSVMPSCCDSPDQAATPDGSRDKGPSIVPTNCCTQVSSCSAVRYQSSDATAQSSQPDAPELAHVATLVAHVLPALDRLRLAPPKAAPPEPPLTHTTILLI